MAGTLAIDPAYMFLTIIFFFISHQFIHLTIAKPITGFSLKLIHRDSPHSPFYPGNLSSHEQIQRLVDGSDARILQLYSMSTSANSSSSSLETATPNTIRPPVANAFVFTYVVLVSIGTPYKSYYLILDTGSDIIWTQCKNCFTCFRQTREPPFDPTSSSTYHVLSCRHPLCQGQGPRFRCTNLYTCSYHIGYFDKSFSKGKYSSETFTFLSDNGALETIPGVFFGCGYINKNFTAAQLGDVEGILGMGNGPHSLIGQIRDRVQSRFSYCYVRSGLHQQHITSFLRFGSDIVIPPHTRVQTTPFVEFRSPISYALNLLDISVEDYAHRMVRMGFPPNTFAQKPDGTGGCIVDSGAALSYIQSGGPFETVREAITRYFAPYHLQIITVAGFNLCYQSQAGYHGGYPSLIFHFQGADFEVGPENLFYFDTNNPSSFFCFGIKPFPGLTHIGAMQQQDVRMVFDLSNGPRGSLSFFPEDCSRDAQ